MEWRQLQHSWRCIRRILHGQAVVKLTQTLSPTLLNETSLDVNGNTIDMSPGRHLCSTGRMERDRLLQLGNNADNRLPQLGFAAPLNTTWTTNYTPWHNSFLDYQIRGRSVLEQRASTDSSSASPYMRLDKNQQLQVGYSGRLHLRSIGFHRRLVPELPPRTGRLLPAAASQQITNHWVGNTAYSVLRHG